MKTEPLVRFGSLIQCLLQYILLSFTAFTNAPSRKSITWFYLILVVWYDFTWMLIFHHFSLILLRLASVELRKGNKPRLAGHNQERKKSGLHLIFSLGTDTTKSPEQDSTYLLSHFVFRNMSSLIACFIWNFCITVTRQTLELRTETVFWTASSKTGFTKPRIIFLCQRSLAVSKSLHGLEDKLGFM